MAMPTDISRSFRLYVTHVDGESHFLKISGQLDQPSSLMIESLFETARENLEKGIGAVPPAAIQEGIICAAKYKDGTYYRAKIINTTNLANGLVGVHFIDYGNKDIISLSTIRFLDNYDPMFLQLRGQASDYYLSRVMHPSGRWEEPVLLKLQSLLCYSEYPATIEATTQTLPIISIQFRGNDLSTHLVANRFGIAIPTAKQEVLLLQFSAAEIQQAPNWQPSFLSEPSYTEHVPFLVNQNFPSNPASAMRLQQNVALQFNGSVPPPSLISQRLLVSNKASRTPVNVKGPIRQPQHAAPAPVPISTTPPSTPPSNKVQSPKKSTTYKSRLLEVGSQHKVFVSFAEDGPELFAVQIVTDAKKLQDMMDDINRRPHSSLAEPPMIGTVCLGRMSGDRIICRAIVMNLSGSQCKLFFVDFGDTEMVSYYDIFDIPEEFVKPNVFAMRFCLSGVKKLEKGPHLNETFKQLVNGKVLTLRVVAPEGPPLIQYGELYLDSKNVLELLLANTKDKLQFKWLEMLAVGNRKSVLVSYVDSCIKFYVQLSEMIDELNAVMEAVKVHCENSSSPGDLPVGAACCARFPDDDNWYRARVRSTNGKKVVVAYVDYGNEQEVDVSDLRTLTPELIRLPAQAMKCALKGYENKPVETKTSNQLEMLALEKTLMAHIVGVLSNDTMLVTLIDDTVSPPLDVARRMTQLSTPRSNIENKPTTPIRKDAPDFEPDVQFRPLSSPEDSEDSRKKSFREKSFKDDRERRPPREQRSEDFGQRGSSFRGRDNKEGFERSGPGRHSDKFSGRSDGRPDRGDRRGGKPWESNQAASVPLPGGDDEWEESTTAQPDFHPPPARQNQGNRRKPRPEQNERGPRSDHHERGPRPDHQERGSRPDHHDRPRNDHHGPRPDQTDRGPRSNWKGKDSGVGKKLRQAAEAASVDSQNQRPFSVQDRLRRENRYNQQNNDWKENKQDDWGNKNRPDRQDRRENRGDRQDNRGDRQDNRGDRYDNRGDRQDNWGDKKENFQKREFRDNNRERGDRTRSNFTPRDRADRSFGSDGDKRSEKSFRSQDGRAPPYKSRSKFTEVQYKELAEPVPLETPFEEPIVETGAQHEVSVTWIISPESFYTQILNLQPKFLEMMHKIPELYKGVKSYTGIVPVGASVLARYPADGVLYRATVVSAQPFSKFIVRYVDFGNKQLVEAKDIWQLDKQLMELPKMAVHCSLLGVAPKDGEWKANPEIDLCFNAPRYQCVFQECVEEQWKVYLWNNSVSVGETLVEKGLAVMSEHQSSVALKDEAIDLTIIVGQQILCKVTHVKSYDEFYVQLDLEKAALVESAVATFDTGKLTPLSQESLADGIHCTVKHEGKIYRAILEATSDPANIQAVLSDYGLSITTSLDNLMILPTELSVYYYQSLQCGLNNCTADSTKLMTLEQLQEKLKGNKFILYIDHVDGIKLMSTLYEVESGQKVAIFEPDEGAYEEVIQLCTRAVFNYNFGMAYISHAETLNLLYLQKGTDTDRIAQLLDELYKFYEEGSPEPATNFEPEALCCAKSSDGNWYRATIVSAEEDNITVQFADYGNSETVPKDSIKILDPKFFEPCALALVTGLGLVALQDEALPKLLEYTADKEVQVTLAIGSDGWLASLHLDGVDLALKLVNEKLATPQTNDAEEPTPETPAEEPISLPSGCTQVYISHIDTPGHFWLQMADKIDKIEEIQAELQANADSYPDFTDRELNTACVAKYLADEQWYRAQILDADADITTVRFTDYGNTDVLDNQPGLIKKLPESLRDIEPYALRSSVNAVPTGTGEWSEAASEHFTSLVGDITTPVDALIVLKDVTTYVDIFVEGHSITDKLVSEGFATKSEPECGGDLPSCFASHVNSPSEFWIQLETATPELQAMESAMVDADNFPQLADKEEGVLCAAKYPEDGAWYRAQVIVDGSEGTEVLFMDYGNASIANELRSLPDELKAKPALSRKCALQKPRDIKSWSRKSEVKFNELAAEGATIFNVQFIASGDISIVELYLEGKSVTEELIGLCEAQPTTERPTPVGQDQLGSGKICYVNSLHEFFVQLDDFAAEIDKLINKMGGAAEFEAAAELKVGSLCAAFWDEDEQWYRAKILEFCDGGYHVQFIDYGNKAKCEEFRQLPEDIAVIEPAAKCCRLTGFGDDAALIQAAKNELDAYAAEATTFQIEFLDSSKEPALVRLFIDGKDIASNISHKANNKEVSENIKEKENDEIKSTDVAEKEYSEDIDNVKENIDEELKPTNVVEEKEELEVVNKNVETELKTTDVVEEKEELEDGNENVATELKPTDVVEEKKELGFVVNENVETELKSTDVIEENEDLEVVNENVETELKTTDVVEEKEDLEVVNENVETELKTTDIVQQKEELEVVNEKVATGLKTADVIEEKKELRVVNENIKTELKTTDVEEKEDLEVVNENVETELKTTDVVEEKEEVKVPADDIDIPEKEIETTEIVKELTPDDIVEKKSETVEYPSSTIISKKDTDGEEISKDNIQKETKDLKEEAAAENEKFTEQEEAIGEEASEINTSLPELNDSIESNNTVVENKSFEGKDDESSNEEFADANDATLSSPEKNVSTETLENSKDTIKTPERDDSKDSLNTDTGYTSDHEKLSPMKEESMSPVKKADSPKKEHDEIMEDKPDTITKKDDEKVEEKVVNKTELKSAE